MVMGASAAGAETRSLKLYFIHTNEKAEIVFKRNGVYDQAGLKKINMFLRDWRRNEPTRMNPRLMDLIWEVYRAVGARDYIHVVCGYRSPATNSMLRSRSSGVAKKSQHMLGNAMDFYIPGVSLKTLRETGMKMQNGGVGYYPRSGSPFVHMDVGNVRHWPKMSRRELVALFPNGKTLHVPSDGKPLPGFDQAMASYQARKKSGTTALALASTGSSKPSRSLFAALFGGGGADDEEDSAPAEEAAPVAKKAAPEPKVAAKPEPKAKVTLPGIQIVAPEDADRADIPMLAEAEPAPADETPETIVAALPARSVPLPVFAARPKTDVGPEETAEISTASVAPQEAVPFAMAAEPPAALAPVQDTSAADAAADAHAPLPSARPNYRVAKAEQMAAAADEASDDDDQDQVLMALVAAERDPLTASDPTPMPADRPASVVADDSSDGEMEDGVIAALPSERPTLADPSAVSAEDKVAVAAAIKANDARVAALASVEASTPKRAVAQPAEQPASAVKTTRKAARAARTDGKPNRKSLVVAAQPQAARWVLNKEYVATAATETKAPSFAYNAVVTAPREVYTAGFQKGDQYAEANRFTGKAVKFLSVARFQ